jgi:uncharacterized protein YcbK (DUF882 family)
MIQSRRRFFTLSLATAATAVSGTEALAKVAHHAKHAAGHSVHGRSHLHLAKGHCAPHHGHHTTLAKGATRRGIAKPYLAKNLATGEAGCAIRKVSLRNLHTDESLDTVYYENGQYLPDAMQDVKRVLRDFRNGQQHEIEPGLVDLLDTIRARTGTSQPFHVISGYRSPQTNAMLHEESSGVAAHSLHMEGEAIDIRLADVALDHLRNAAFSLQRGGVGYYQDSNFVHVDVGDVRHWGFNA